MQDANEETPCVPGSTESNKANLHVGQQQPLRGTTSLHSFLRFNGLLIPLGDETNESAASMVNDRHSAAETSSVISKHLLISRERPAMELLEC